MHKRVFAGLCVGSVAIWLHPLRETLHLALSDERYTHLLLVVPLACSLTALQWRTDRLPAKPSMWGTIVMAAGLLGYAALPLMRIDVDVRLSGSIFGLVLWWLGAFLLCFGAQTFQSVLFPLLLLLGTVPLPGRVLDPVVSFLQRSSAVSAEALFRVARAPVSLHGSVLSLPGLDLEVAPECSSIRSSLFLIVIAMGLAQIFLRSPRRKLAVVLASLPLTFLKNGLRIFVLGWLATHGNPWILNSRLHRQGGPVFLMIALAAVFVLIWMLRRGDRHLPASRNDNVGAARATSSWEQGGRAAF